VNKIIKIDDNKFVNLSHISHITLEYGKDRAILKMDFSISPIIKKKRKIDKNDFNVEDLEDSTTNERKGTITACYMYVYGIQDLINKLHQSEYFNENFIRKQIDVDDHDDIGWFNINSISSIKIDDKQNRVILNFDNSVSFYDLKAGNRLISEFKFLDFINDKRFNNYVNYLNKNLESR